MASSIQFKEVFLRDNRQAVTLERAVRLTSAFAGIHRFDFENAIDEDFASLDDWITDPAAAWSAATGRLVATGGGGGLWYQARHSTQVAPSFVASFDRVSGDGALVFYGKDSADDCFVAWWTDSTCGIGRISDAGALTNLVSMPYGISGSSRIQVSVRYNLDSVDENRRWIVVNLFADGECLVGAASDIGETALDWDGNYIGFAVYDGNTMTVDNLTIQDLCRIVEWTMIDPGATAATGQSRAIATTRIKHMMRFDETMRVWRPEDRELDWAIPNSRVIQFDDRSNKTKTLTHVRTQAAIHEVDYISDAEGEVHMHRFTIRNDPNVMTVAGAYAEAYRVIHDSKEGQVVARIVFPPNPLLEPYDRVSYDGTDYRIVSISRVLAMQDNTRPAYRSTIDVRGYLTLGEAPDRS